MEWKRWEVGESTNNDRVLPKIITEDTSYTGKLSISFAKVAIHASLYMKGIPPIPMMGGLEGGPLGGFDLS